MPDIFDEVAGSPKATTGDIFDQVAAQPAPTIEQATALPAVPRLPKINLFKGVTPAPRDRSIAEGLTAQQAENQGYGTWVEPNRTSFFTNRDPLASGVQTASSTPQVNLSPVEQPPATIDTGSYSDPTSEKRQALEHLKNRGTFGPAIEQVAKGATDLADSGVLERTVHDINAGPTAQPTPEELQQGLSGASDLMEGSGTLASPLIAEGLATNAIHSAGGLAAGVAASAAAGEVADKLGATPQEKRFAENLGFWGPTMLGRFIKPSVSLELSPEAKSMVGEAFGGKVAGGIEITPEEIKIGGKIGGKKVGARIPRGPQEPQGQTIEGESPTVTNAPTAKEPVAALPEENTRPEAQAPSTEPIAPSTETNQPFTETSAPTAPDRRQNPELRKRVEEMTPEERAQALLTSETTGLPNRRAFDEAQQTPAPAIAMSDADGLKALNDKFGYEAGNAMLHAKADALQQAGVESYHDKGDEFLYRGESPEALQQKLENARAILRDTPIQVTLPDGSVKYFKGADFSYGTGQDLQEAETGLKAHKSSREATGQRARGELRGIAEYPVPAGNEGAVSEAHQAPAEQASAEVAQPTKYKYGNTQANIPSESEAAHALEVARQRISDSDLAGDGKDVGGNHITVRYGIDGDDVEGIKRYLAQQKPFTATLGKTETFPPSKSSDGAAVIQAPIESPELHRLNAELEQHGKFIPPTFDEYKPHATVAYVKPEVANRYVGMSVTQGKQFTVDSIAISKRDGSEEVVKLGGAQASKPSPIPAIQAAKPKAPKAPKAPSVIPPWERTSPDLNYIARTGKPGYSMEDQVHIALPDQPEQAIPNAKAAVYRDQNGNAIGALKFEVKNGKPEGLQVFVKPEARRQGIASKLYETAQQAGYDVESSSGTAVTPDGKAFIEGRRAKQQTPSLQEHEVEIQPEPQQPFKVGDRVEYVGALDSYRRKALKIGFMNSHGTSVRLDNVATGERLGGWFSPTELKHSDIKTPEEQRMLADFDKSGKGDDDELGAERWLRSLPDNEQRFVKELWPYIEKEGKRGFDYVSANWYDVDDERADELRWDLLNISKGLPAPFAKPDLSPEDIAQAEFESYDDMRAAVKKGDTVYWRIDDNQFMGGKVEGFDDGTESIDARIYDETIPVGAPIKPLTDRLPGRLSAQVSWSMVRTSIPQTIEGNGPTIEGETPQRAQLTGETGHSKTGLPALAESVYQKLKAGESLGNNAAFNTLAEQSLGAGWRTSADFSPKDAYDAMEAGVNKYLADVGKELMSLPAEEGLARLKQIEQLLPTQNIRTDEQISHQQFSTPPRESYLVARVADVQASDSVLEPSAGNGGLAVFPKSVGATVYVNEIAPRRVAMLKEVGFDKITSEDGELINAKLPTDIKPTIVIMNPPFSAKAAAGVLAKHSAKFGFNHVTQALQRLEPNGRLVAILGGGRDGFPREGASFDNPAAKRWFDQMAAKYNIRANVRVSGKEYQKYGTTYATRIIVIDKNGPTPNWVNGESQSSPANLVNTSVDSLEQAYNALSNVAATRPTRQADAAGSVVPGVRQGNGSLGGETGREPQTGITHSQPAGRPTPVAGLERPAGSVSGNEPGTGAGVPAVREPGSQPQTDSGRSAIEGAGAGSQDVAERPLGSDERGLTPTAPEKLDLTQEGQQDDREQEDSGQFVTYKPRLKGPAHPGDIVETKTMATVPLPPLTYKPSLPESVIENGKLSAVQIEAIAIAGQQNNIVLPSGERASALIGDGTGVGKGRISAGILWDNWNQGRKRLIWVSEKWDLMQDAIRDLNGIGATELAKTIKAFQKFDVTEPIQHDGIIFSTYALIRSADKKGNTRVSQLQNWLKGNDNAEGAYILYDESHNLKNAVSSGRAPASQIGQAVQKMMAAVPNLRSASLSATAASDVMNLGYLDRLGLWGPGTPFPSGFQQFAAEIGQGGISAMEMIARALKGRGKYIARSLSYKGVTYDMPEHKLTTDQKEVYRTAAKAWRSVQQRAETTISETLNGGGRARGNFLSQFYSAQQRFFNLLITTLKIPAAVERANAALANKQSVLITLVNTNEAAQNREKAKVAADMTRDADEPPDYDFGPKNLLIDLVRSHFPTQQWEDYIDSDGRPAKRPVVDADGKPVQNPEAIRERDALIAELDRDLNMPDNPLDILINSLGGPAKVAELTGRKERVDASTGRLVPRGGEDVPHAKVNLNEMQAFQSGKKRVAILSSAAGTGISLHAGNDVKNQQKRIHITLQAGWSADKAMQMLGRSHRTNQAQPPHYDMLVSDLGGEKRFIASISRRLGSLGALSRGQKGATGGTDAMDKFNFESAEGRAATRAFYEGLLRSGAMVPGTDVSGMDVLRDMGVLKIDKNVGETVPDEDRVNVTRLLNRILSLDPDVQNAVYDFYYDIFQAVVQRAIDDGTLDTGVRTIPGDAFHVKEERALATDPATGAKTFYYPVDAEIRTRRVSPQDLAKQMAKEKQHELLVNDKGQLLFARPARPIVHANGSTTEAAQIISPDNGVWEKVAQGELTRKYQKLDEYAQEKADEARKNLASAERERGYYEGYNSDRFKKQLEEIDQKIAAAKEEITQAEAIAKDSKGWFHDNWEQQFNDAPAHKTVEHHLIGGDPLAYWNPIRDAVAGQLHVLTAVDSASGKRVVGVEIPPQRVRGLLDRISGGKSTVNADQLSTDVLKNNLTYTLEQNIQVRRGTIARKQVIQLFPPNQSVAENLKRLGVQFERGMTPVYYVPMKDTFGGGREADATVLKKVLKEYPVKASEAGESDDLDQFGPGPGAKTDSNSSGLPSEVPVSPIGQVTESLKRMASPKGAQKITAPQSQPQGPESGAAHALDVARQAIAAVTNWWKRGAIDKDNFDFLIRDWDGGQQEAGIKFENFLKAARKAHPDAKVQDAMRVALDESGPDSIKEHAELVKDRAPYDKALNLTPEERTTVNNLRGLEEAMLEEAIKVGMMEAGVEAYILHAYKRPWGKRFFKGTFAELNFSSLQPNPSFTKRRVHDTYADAEVKAGLVPKTKSAFDLVAMRYMAQAKAIADRALIKQILTGDAKDGRPWAVVAGGMKMPKGSEGDESTYLVRPRVHGQDTGDYVLIDHPALRRWKWVGEDENGKVFLQGDAYVHPEIASRLKNILGKSKIREFEIGPDFLRVRPGNLALRASSEFKGVLLGFGGIFHQDTLAVHGLEHRVNPVNLPELDMEQPMQRRAVHGGLMVFDARGLTNFTEGLSPEGTLVGKVPIQRQYSAYLFRSYIPRLKMAMWLHARERNEARYGDPLRAEGLAKLKAENPTMSDKKAKRVAAALVEKQLDALTADQANAAFGELNYNALARNKTLQDAMRLLFLAPDFFESRARFVGQAARGYGREQLVALALGAAVMLTGAAVINAILNNGNPRLDHPMAIVYKGHVYSLRTVQGDIMHLASDIGKHGFPREFLSSRINPTTTGTVAEAMFGRDLRTGQKRTTPEQIGDFAKRVAPIPFQGFIQQWGTNTKHEVIASMLKMIGVNSKRDQTPAQERATELAMESGHKPTNRPQAGILSMFRRQIAEGQFDRRDVDRQVAEGKITPKDRTAILKQTAQSKLRRDFSQLSLDDALNVWGEMNDQEREQMRGVLRQKAEKELSRYPAGPEKQALRQKVDEAMAPKKSVLPGFLRKFSSSTALPTASK